MPSRKTANDVAADLAKHDAICQERWKTIYKKTDELQASVNSIKGWLLAGLTTILISMFMLVLRGLL
jgi:hypothetical protein|tara:strand:+ start:1625 stop:1825 length:201 start_codon:yes stop_codon:yes gene_type:complete